MWSAQRLVLLCVAFFVAFFAAFSGGCGGHSEGPAAPGPAPETTPVKGTGGASALPAQPDDAGSSSPGTGGAVDAMTSGPAAADAAGADAAAVEGEAGLPPQSFTCTLVLGTNQTAEWFDVGFEDLVDGSKWQLMHAHSAFVELWADPDDPVWSSPITSRCAQGATTPDRIIFLALAGGPNGGLSNYALEKWLPLLNADLKNIRAKYPSARRIELMSYLRGPKNGTCPGTPEHRTVVFPSQDEAMAMVAAANPGLVAVAPRWEARSCADFGDNPPHPTPQAAMAWARMIAEHYGLGR
jgi:hypothetical protein